MAYQTWIADKIREYGVQVVEVAGWQTRGSSTFNPQAVIAHHTASRAGADAPALRICTHGRSDLPGPLCQVLLSRSGIAYIVAAGRANHAGRGGALGLTGNTSVFGIEAENNGVGEPWSPEQIEAYYRVTAALLDGIGKTGSHVVGHKEWAPKRKIDPAGIDMGSFRWEVDQRLGKKPTSDPTPSKPGYRPEQGPNLEEGEHGFFTACWQHLLNKNTGTNLEVDGYFGPATTEATKNFQRFFGLKVDGIAGPKTMGLMKYIDALKADAGSGTSRPTLREGDRGEHVSYLQKKIGRVAVDGIFGRQTLYRVKKIQRLYGLKIDGIVGPKTWGVLESL